MKTNAWVWRVSLLLSSFLVMLNAEPANTAFAQSNQKPYGESVARLLSGVDEELVKEFKNAWVSSHAGASELESVVLIFKMRDGRYLGKLQRNSYEFKKASFRWPSNV